MMDATGIPQTSSSVRFPASTLSDNDVTDENHQRSMKLFIGTANLGNAAPDESSWNAWIPADGYYGTSTNTNGGDGINKYPLRCMIYNNDENNINSQTTGSTGHVKMNMESNEPHYCMDTVPLNDGDHSYQQYDILIFGMQEATFDPPSKTIKTEENTKPDEEVDRNGNHNMETPADGATMNTNNSTNPDHSIDIGTNDAVMKEHANAKQSLSPIKSPTKLLQTTLSNTTTKAVHTTTKAVQKIQRTTEKTINKVQTLSTSRDHCKPDATAQSRLSFPSVSSSSFMFRSDRRNRRNNAPNEWGKSSQSTPQLLNVINDDEDNDDHHNESELPTSPTTATGWLGGTSLLLQLYQQRLPSYIPIVNYQRGEMRLIIYVHQKHYHDIQVKYVTAQNTGRAGLANKGGIVTELICYNQTRISFLTAHLEAHEGYTKYMARIQSIADIFNGTTRYAESPAQTQTPSSLCIHDCSITSHYSFVMGDLNFRTEMSNEQKTALSIHDEDEYKQMIYKLIAEKEYDRLNDMDELHRGLYNKDCLVGYETLLCNFPPTFKVERELGYHYIDKRRPSYTDRILFKSNLSKSNTNTIQPLLYEPIDDFKSSDHKPIRAAFTVQLNEPYMLRPKLTKRRSTMKLANLIHANRKSSRKDFTASLELGQKERFHLFVTHMNCDIHDPNRKNFNTKIGSNSSLSLVTTTLQEIYTGIPNPYICLVSDPIDLLHHQVDKGWNLLWYNTIKRTLQLKSSSHSKKRSSAKHHTCFLNTYGFPRSSIQRQQFAAEWDHNEEIHTEIRTHHLDGSPIDLTGAMLQISVMNHRQGRGIINKTTSAVTGAATDNVIGTVTINLVDLMRQCRATPAQRKGVSSNKMDSGIEVQMSSDPTKPSTTSIIDDVKCSSTSTKVGNDENNRNVTDEDDDDPIARVDIDEPIIKNGIETGRLRCQLEIWWTDGTITKAFSPIGNIDTKTKPGPVGRRQRRINNRQNISNSSKSDIAMANFQRRPPVLPDRRAKETSVN